MTFNHRDIFDVKNKKNLSESSGLIVSLEKNRSQIDRKRSSYIVFHPRYTIVSRLIFSTPVARYSFRTFPCNVPCTRAQPWSGLPHLCARLINHHSSRQRQISLFLARETVCPRAGERLRPVINSSPPLPPFPPFPVCYQLRTTLPPLSSIAQRALHGGETSKANGTYEDGLRLEPCLFASARNRANEICWFFHKSVDRPTIKRPQWYPVSALCSRESRFNGKISWLKNLIAFAFDRWLFGISGNTLLNIQSSVEVALLNIAGKNQAHIHAIALPFHLFSFSNYLF